MSKLFGVSAIVTLSIDNMGEVKELKLGARSDDFKDAMQFERAVHALGASLDYSVYKLIHDGKVDDLKLPFRS